MIVVVQIKSFIKVNAIRTNPKVGIEKQAILITELTFKRNLI
jgi:hypothetical protein